MKQTFFLLILVFLYFSAGSQNLELVWSDEFDYTGLPDSEKWSYDTGGHGWGNNESQYYTEDRTQNARVENGKLIIEAHKEDYNGSDYTSARLVSRGKGDWRYGRIEVKAKLPGGRGSWPAIWMLPTDWVYGGWPASGEIDIMEYVGYDPGVVHGTVHTQAYNHSIGTQVGESINVPDAETAFHVYALEWSETQIKLYVDETHYFTFNSSDDWTQWPFDKRFHLLLNIAIGGNWGGAQGIDDTIFPIRMEVDYVRVYQSASEIQISGENFLQPNQQGATYTAPNIVGGNYQWSVPGDARIASGQGTNAVEINWGENDGDIELLFTKDTTEITVTKNIKTVLVPPEGGAVLHNFDDGVLDSLFVPQSEGNSFAFTEVNGALKFVYQVQDAGAAPHFELVSERPVNMSNHPEFALDIKTHNLSNSVILRVDLEDTQGHRTDYSPVFNLFDINDDGEFHTYQRNFSDHWTTADPYGASVDKTQIRKFIFYANFGVYGIDNRQDSVWIDNLTAREASNGIFTPTPPQGNLKIYPSPAHEKIHICLPETQPAPTNYTLRIFSPQGKAVRQETIGAENLCLNVATLEKGFYILQLETKTKLFYGRFLKI